VSKLDFGKERYVKLIFRACLVTIGVLAGFYPLAVWAQEEIADRILAVVQRDVILQSEVDEYLTLQMLQSGRAAETLSRSERDQLRCQILEAMIDDRILVAKARTDSVEVTLQQVEEALRQQLENIKRQFASEEEFREQLRKEGTTERDLRTKLRMQMERYLLREKLTQQFGQKVTVTFSEIERFYNEKRDSLPTVPASVTIGHITRLTRPGDSALVVARRLIDDARGRLAAGEDFGDVAKAMSQDPGSAPFGGDLGFFGRAQMVPEFETTAFSLDSGQVSAPFLTEYGLHIIQNLGFRGDQVHARHILARAIFTPSDRQATLDTMQSVFQRLRSGADFSEMARTYSMEQSVRQTNGRVGPIEPGNLPPSFGSVLATLSLGETGEPFESDPGTFHIVRLIDRTRAHSMNMVDDRRQLEELVRQKKLFERMREVLDTERGRVYVDVRLPGCGGAAPR
jgi:peptidyl-prolyl cis-trans isomerase SurA